MAPRVLTTSASSASGRPAPAANRAERRRRRPPRRSSTRVAQGAVAVGLALGVGGFALTPATADRTASEAAAEQAVPETPVPQSRVAPQVVQQRKAAVVLASTTAQEAGSVAADAVASDVPDEVVSPLTDAVAQLDALITATQLAQPAIRGLLPEVKPAPIAPAESLIEAATDPAALAAAADGTTTAADEVEPAESDDAPAGATDTPMPTADTTDEDLAATRLAAAVERVETLTAEIQDVTERAQQAAAAAAAEEAARAEANRRDAQRTSLDAYENGQVPLSALCELSFAPGQQLRCDAAEALEGLNAAFAAAFGSNLSITDSYRSYGAQVACREQKGSLCATPGTSNHGTGTAVDLGGNGSRFGTREHNWLLAHAEEHGWTLPAWARATGSKPEPWHWEFIG